MRISLSGQVRNLYNCNPLSGLDPVVDPSDERFAPREVEPHQGGLFAGPVQLTHVVDDNRYSALVGDAFGLACRLDITFYERQGALAISSQIGDLDNKAKSLLDALRMPQSTSPGLPQSDETIHCLLEDDSFVWDARLRNARLLHPSRDQWETLTKIEVELLPRETTLTNLNLFGVPVS